MLRSAPLGHHRCLGRQGKPTSGGSVLENLDDSSRDVHSTDQSVELAIRRGNTSRRTNEYSLPYCRFYTMRSSTSMTVAYS
jgi:hypothetical protein